MKWPTARRVGADVSTRMSEKRSKKFHKNRGKLQYLSESFQNFRLIYIYRKLFSSKKGFVNFQVFSSKFAKILKVKEAFICRSWRIFQNCREKPLK